MGATTLRRIFNLLIVSTFFISSLFVPIDGRPGNPNGERPCKIEFNNENLDSEKTSEIVQDCLNTFPMRNLNGSETEQEKMRIVIENQNNCALKCINENLNVTTEEGRVDVTKLLNHFQDSNASGAYVARLTSLLTQCANETEDKIQHLQSGFEKNICRYHVMFMHCYRDAYMAARPEINKVNRSVKKRSDGHAAWDAACYIHGRKVFRLAFYTTQSLSKSMLEMHRLCANH